MELAVQRELFVIKSLPRGGRTLEVVRRYGLACNLRYSPLYNGIEIGRKGCSTQAECEECSQHAIAHGKRHLFLGQDSLHIPPLSLLVISKNLLEVVGILIGRTVGRKTARIEVALNALTYRRVLHVVASDFLVFLLAVVPPLHIPQDIGRGRQSRRS